jgi:zinc protease
MPAAGQAGVVLALPLPPRQGAERAAADVLDAVLGGGYSSRLSQEIRIKRGLSYSVSSWIEPRGASGLFQAGLQTKNESTAEAVSLLQGELDRIRQTPVPADELTSRKLSLIGGFSRSVETTAGLASAIRSLVASGRAPADLKTRIAALEAVEPADVQRYAATHFGAGRPADRRGRRGRALRRHPAQRGARARRRRPGPARSRAPRRTETRLGKQASGCPHAGRARRRRLSRPTRCGVKANPSGAAISLLGQ